MIFLRGVPTPKDLLFCQFLAENCLKMKEFGPQGARVPGAPLDPPMNLIHSASCEYSGIVSNTGSCLQRVK